MVAHRFAGALWIVLAQCRQNAPMLADSRLHADAPRPLQHIDAQGRLVPHIPEILDDRGDRRVAGGARDGNVKAAVRNLAFLLARILIDHFRDNALHFLQFFIGNGRCGKRRRLAFEQPARLSQFKRTNIQIARSDLRGRLVGHIDPGAVPRLGETADFKGYHGLANRRPAYLECDGKISFRRQALTGPVVSADDRRHNGAGDLLIELAGIGRGGHEAGILTASMADGNVA